MAAEKKEFSPLFVPTRESGKLYKLDDHIQVSVSGVVADANFLVDYGRLHSQRHTYSQHTPIYVESLVQYLANYKHGYTQFGSSRPFGVSLMYAGYDKVCGFQLYCSDPSGNYAAWKAHATGRGSVNATSQLKDEFKENLSLHDATVLAAKVLAKTIDMTKPDPTKFEIGVVKFNDEGKVIQTVLEGAELMAVLNDPKVFEEKK